MGRVRVHAQPRILAARRVRVFQSNVPQNNEGAEKAGCPPHPQPGVRKDESTPASSPQVQPDQSGLPRANGFNGFLRDLLGEPGFVATVAYGKPQA